MKKIVCLLMVAMFVLAGCSKNGKKEKPAIVCTTEAGTDMTLTTKLVNDGEQVLREEVTYVIKTTDDATKKATKDTFDLLGEEYAGVKGVTFKVEETKDGIKVTLIADYENGDLEKFAELGIIQASGSKVERVGLDVTKKSYESQGYTCK